MKTIKYILIFLLWNICTSLKAQTDAEIYFGKPWSLHIIMNTEVL